MLAQILRAIRRQPPRSSSSRELALHIEPRVTVEDRCVLKRLVKQSVRPGGIVVEVGSFLGNGSTQTFVEALTPLSGTLYCVDTWRGNENVPWHQQMARAYDLFGTFRHYVALADGTRMVKPMVMPSRDAARVLADGVADLVFIDGDHAYSGVKEDIEIWRPKVRKGGILCGHDCEGRIEEFGADRVAASLEGDFVPVERHTFAGFHPGPVTAVTELLGDAAMLWAHRSLTEEGFDERRRSSIWHVDL